MLFLENLKTNTPNILLLKDELLGKLMSDLKENEITHELSFSVEELRNLESLLVEAFLNDIISPSFFEKNFLGFLFYIGQVFIEHTPNSDWGIKIQQGRQTNIYIPIVIYDDKFKFSEFVAVLFDVTYDLDFPAMPEIGNAYSSLVSEYVEFSNKE